MESDGGVGEIDISTFHLQSLPSDVLRLIAHHVGGVYSNRVLDDRSLAPALEAFNHFHRAHPLYPLLLDQYHALDATTAVEKSAVRTLTSRLGRRFRHVAIHLSRENLSDSSLHYIAAHHPSLCSLSVLFMYPTLYSIDLLNSVLRSSAASLHALHLDLCYIHEFFFKPLDISDLNLQILYLRLGDVDHHEISHLLSSTGASLHTLSLHACHVYSVTEKTLADVALHCPRIAHLSIKALMEYAEAPVCTLAAFRADHLRSLHVALTSNRTNATSGLSVDSLAYISEQCTQLEHVNIDVRKDTINALKALVSLTHVLRSLNLSLNETDDGYQVVSLLSSFEKLDALRLHGCIPKILFANVCATIGTRLQSLHLEDESAHPGENLRQIAKCTGLRELRITTSKRSRVRTPNTSPAFAEISEMIKGVGKCLRVFKWHVHVVDDASKDVHPIDGAALAQLLRRYCTCLQKVFVNGLRPTRKELQERYHVAFEHLRRRFPDAAFVVDRSNADWIEMTMNLDRDLDEYRTSYT